MKFKSQIVTAASGSIGGTTYGHTRGVMYQRGRGMPTNPNSTRQQAIRIALGTISAAWSALTDSEREAWKLYAQNSPLSNVFGDPLTLTGQQMYVRVNAPRLQAGEDQIDAAPTTFGATSLSPITLAAAAASPGTTTGTFTAGDPWADEDDGRLYVYVGRPRSAGRAFYNGPFRFAGVVDGVNGTPPAGTGALADPDALDYTAGQIITVRYVAQTADGRPSPAQLVTATVA
jgi:hypothetical protein